MHAKFAALYSPPGVPGVLACLVLDNEVSEFVVPDDARRFETRPRLLEPIVGRLRDGVLRHHYSVTCRHNTLSSETTSPKAQTPANQAPANMSGANAMAQTSPPMAFTHTMYLATRDARADARTERSPASSAKTTAPMSSMTGNGLVVAAR